MTDHQHLAEGYGDASVPCSTKSGAIPARDDEVLRLLKDQTYNYYGKDGKPVLARDLEDERDALKAEVKRLREEVELFREAVAGAYLRGHKDGVAAAKKGGGQ